MKKIFIIGLFFAAWGLSGCASQLNRDIASDSSEQPDPFVGGKHFKGERY